MSTTSEPSRAVVTTIDLDPQIKRRATGDEHQSLKIVVADGVDVDEFFDTLMQEFLDQSLQFDGMVGGEQTIFLKPSVEFAPTYMAIVARVAHENAFLWAAEA